MRNSSFARKWYRRDLLGGPGAGTACGQVSETTDLPVINGVEWQYGLCRQGSEQRLLERTKAFYQAIPASVSQTDALYEQVLSGKEGALERFAQQMKSVGRETTALGIISVAGMAAVLVQAAERRDEYCIRAITPHLLEGWKNLEEALRPLFEA